MKWTILDTGISSAEKNMAFDRNLLDHLHEPLLHFYEWEADSATYGHFIKPFQFLNQLEVEKKNLCLAQRPTGGGIVFHLFDFAYSVLVPLHHPFFSLNTLDNYLFINSIIKSSIEKFLNQSEVALLPIEAKENSQENQSFCMAKPTKFDVMFQGYKVGGAAQRKTNKGYLHQGTISLSMPSDNYLEDVLGKKSSVLSAMKRNSFLMIGANPTKNQLREARSSLKQLLIDEFTQ